MAERQYQQGTQGQNVQGAQGQSVSGQNVQRQQGQTGITRGSPQGELSTRGGNRSQLGAISPLSSPFTFMRRFMEEMDNLFEDFGMGPSLYGGGRQGMQTRGESLGTRLWAPQIETFERDNQLVVRADLPGVSKNDVRVRLDQDVLTIEGERRYEHDETRGSVYQSERSYGSFQRSIRLPEGVDPESIKASFDNGVLEVCMNAPQHRAGARDIEIGSGTGASGQAGPGTQGQKNVPSH